MGGGTRTLTTPNHSASASYLASARHVPNQVHQAHPPGAVRGEVGESGPMRCVPIRVDGGLGAVEYLPHLGVLLHPSVQPLVVVAVLHVANGRRDLHQGVVRVFAGGNQHHTFPLALEVACIHAQEL